MKLSKSLKKILLVGSAVLMFASVGAGASNTTASAKRYNYNAIARIKHHSDSGRFIGYRIRGTRRHYKRHHAVRRHRATRRYRHSRRTHRYYRKYTYKHYIRKHGKRANKLNAKPKPVIKNNKPKAKATVHYNKQTDPKFDAQQSEDAIEQMNGYRRARGLKPYQEDKQLDNIAMMRAKNMATHKEPCAHYDKNGHGYAEEDAYKLGYIKSPTEDDFDENIAAGYTNSKGANNDFMYHDGPDWGHRDNILGKIPGEGANYTGAGYYDGYLVEEFTYSNDLEYNYDH